MTDKPRVSLHERQVFTVLQDANGIFALEPFAAENEK